jgi:hypothetical protein
MTSIALSYDCLYLAVGTKSSYITIYGCSNWKEIKKIMVDGEKIIEKEGEEDNEV